MISELFALKYQFFGAIQTADPYKNTVTITDGKVTTQARHSADLRYSSAYSYIIILAGPYLPLDAGTSHEGSKFVVFW